MSAAPEPINLPIQHVHTLVEASAFDTPVVIFCIGCGRSHKADPQLLARKLGPLPFGLIVGVFACRRCQARVSAVFPWYAPTPHEWAKIARDHLPKPEEPRVYVDGRQFPYRIDLWHSNHQIIARTLAFIDNSSVADLAFEQYLQLHPRDDITLRNVTMLMRDSRRPEVKPVK